MLLEESSCSEVEESGSVNLSVCGLTYVRTRLSCCQQAFADTKSVQSRADCHEQRALAHSSAEGRICASIEAGSRRVLNCIFVVSSVPS